MASPVWGLLCGILFSLLFKLPFTNQRLANFHGPMLKVAVVGLGFGLNINNVVATGKEGLLITIILLLIIGSVGFLLARIVGLNMRTALLITSGTAICGGSAIAAMSPIVRAKGIELSVAMGVVFVLNAVALMIFPIMGRWLDMSDAQFGWWAAMAIHDTSSVVGAAAQFGNESLALATTVKLTRVLWIIPVSLLTAIVMQSDTKKFSIPYFIGFFLVAVALSTYIPFLQTLAPMFSQVSKIIFTIVLFLIGLGLNRTAFNETGFRPLLYGMVLWMISVLSSLLLVNYLNDVGPLAF